eukprot:TRINITY_DN47593_c0_g1_i1.p1 TRINITY_DN47593_c0_g1~~TRINITY_DN47593_c0_g1_i1.p1  ORF type:complete len:457 (+),score=77.40 TRINITY_DN47593_c0_g1_i1:73-1443(+)
MSYELCNGNSSWPSTPCPDTKDGRHLISWAATSPYPATCTYTVTEVASVFMGMLSILFWMMVTMPQLWVNYKSKEAEGLSIFFLLQWFGGDITNLIGCFLTNQTTSQTFLAMYYVCQDICLTSQFIYYTRIYKRKPQEEAEETPSGSTPSDTEQRSIQEATPQMYKGQNSLGDFRRVEKHPSLGDLRRAATGESVAAGINGSEPRSPTSKAQAFTMSGSYVLAKKDSDSFLRHSSIRQSPSTGVVLKGALVMLLCTTGGYIGSSMQSSPTAHESLATRRLLTTDDGSNNDPSVTEEQYYIGTAIGWVSAALYLGSRVPQLLKNWRRGSTDGLSPVMFTMAVCANVTYFLGMILLDSSTDSVLCHLPWIVGSLGTVQFDMMALFQFLYFRNNVPADVSSDEETEGEALLGDGKAERQGLISEILNGDHQKHHQPMLLHHRHQGVANRHSYYGRLGIF